MIEKYVISGDPDIVKHAHMLFKHTHMLFKHTHQYIYLHEWMTVFRYTAKSLSKSNNVLYHSVQH